MTTIPKKRPAEQAPPDDYDSVPPYFLAADAAAEVCRQAAAEADGQACWDAPPDVTPQGGRPDPDAGGKTPKQSRHAPVTPKKPHVAPPPKDTAAAETQTPVAARWADAEKNLLGNMVARASDMPTRHAQHIVHLLAARDALSAYHWASARNQAVFAAAIRIAESGTYPGPEAIQGELRRIAAAEAADFAGELAREFFSDAELLHWAAQCRELAGACEIYIAAGRVKDALDAGQTVADVLPLLADVQSAAEPLDVSDGPISAGDLIAGFPELRPYVIDGLLRVGETANIIAAPKIGKSWLLLSLLLSVATGTPWMGRECRQGRVLLLDNELHRETLARRIHAVAMAMGVDPESLQDGLVIQCLRGEGENIDSFGRFFRRMKPGEYSVIAIDALYRALPPDCEENVNQDMMRVYNTVDGYSERTGAAFLLVHHASKGLQSEKQVTDVGSGAGAISRAADVHVIIRPHEEDGAAVMDCRVRSGVQPAAMGLRWAYPLWMPDLTLDTKRLLTAKPRRMAKSHSVDDAPPGYMTVVAHAGPDPKPLGWFAAKACDGKEHAARSLLRQAVAVGALHHWPAKKARDFERWATVPQGLA